MEKLKQFFSFRYIFLMGGPSNRPYIYIILYLLILFIFSCNQSNPKQTHRIICLTPNHTEILYALGLESSIVGWTQYCNYPPEVQEVPGWVRYDKYEFVSVEEELKKKIPVVSRFIQVNMALIDSLKPTLILSSHEAQEDIAEDLSEKGYKVLHFSPVTLEETFEMMIKIGEATGSVDRANELVAQYRKEIEEIQRITKNLPKVKVYFEINHMGPYVLGSGSPMDQMIDIAGGKNVFDDVEGEAYDAYLSEIISRNPEVILTPLWPAAGQEEVTTIYEVVSREGFADLTAVINSRVYHYDSSLLKRPGPRSVQAIKKLAYLLHPYYFENPSNSVDPWELGKIDETYPPPKALR